MSWAAILISCTLLAFFVSGCICCGSCELFHDDFSSDDLATNWDVASGTWSISSGLLHCTTTNSRIDTVTENVVGLFHYKSSKATVDITGATGDIARVYVGDSYGEIKFGSSGYLAIYDNTGTLIVKRNLNIPTSGTYCASINYYVTRFDFQLLTGAAYAISAPVAAASGSTTGLGTGATASNITFDNFTMSEANDPAKCPPCGGDIQCGNCNGSGNVIPNGWWATISGVATAGALPFGKCFTCGTINDSFMLHPGSSIVNVGTSETGCGYGHPGVGCPQNDANPTQNCGFTFPIDFCPAGGAPANLLSLCFWLDCDGTHLNIVFSIMQTSPVGSPQLYMVQRSPRDCLTPTEIHMTSANLLLGSGSYGYCDWTHVDITLDAIY